MKIALMESLRMNLKEFEFSNLRYLDDIPPLWRSLRGSPPPQQDKRKRRKNPTGNYYNSNQ